MLNVKREDVKIFRRYLQENIMAFHPNVQVCKSKLQSYPYPENFGYMMYCANNIQVIHLISNFLEVIEKENTHKIKILVQLEVALQTNLGRKIFYKNYNRNDEK